MNTTTMYDFKDKVALVTGAAQGIGKAYVQHLLEQDVKVMMSDVKKSLGEVTRAEFAKKFGEKNIAFIECDVCNAAQFEESFKATIQEFGKLDILINNAGICNDLDPGWEKTIEINFAALVKGTYLGLKYMGKHEGHNGGTIVNIGSLTTFNPCDCCPIYSSTKAAVNQFTRSVGTAVQFKRTGIRMICVNPGLTDTQIVNDCAATLFPGTKEVFQELTTNTIKQGVDMMGKGVIDILRKAKTGSLWVIEGNQAPQRIDFIVERYDD